MQNTKLSDEQAQKAKELYQKYNIADVFFGYLIAAAIYNNISEDVIDDICTSSDVTSIMSAKLLAVIVGVDSYDSIENTSDIEKYIRKESTSESNKLLNNSIEKYETLFEEINKVKDSLEDFKSSSVFSFDEGTKQSINSISETMEKSVEGIIELKEKNSENIGENNRKLSQCIEALLELTECNLALLKEVSNIKEALEKPVQNENVQDIFDSFALKMLEKQNALFEENRQYLDDLSERIIETLVSDDDKESIKKKQFFFKNKENKQNAKLKTKEKTDEEVMKKFKEVSERISMAPENDIFDVFDLIRTGIFNDEQCKVIRKGLDNKLTPIQILEYASPENSAKTMQQLLDFLVAKKPSSKKTTRIIKKDSDSKKEE